MDEQTNIGFIVRARILPHIEGMEEFQQKLENAPKHISAKMQDVVQQPAFREGTTPQQQRMLEHFAEGRDVLEFQEYRKKINETLRDLDIDLEVGEGKLNKAQIEKHQRRVLKQRYELGDFVSTIQEQVSDMDIPKEQKDLITKTITESGSDALNVLDDLNDRFKEMFENLKNNKEESTAFFENLRQIGAFALAGTLINMGLNYATRTAGIEAKERTSFDFGSPLGMYSTRQQYELYKVTEERLREAELFGGLGGMAAGALAGIPLGPAGIVGGAVAGGLLGSSIMTKLANIENIEDRAKVEEELNFLNQGWATLSNYVNQAQQFDILRTRTRARLKENFEDVGFGYTQEQLAQYQLQFGDTFGKYDSDLYKEQLAFSRAEGIDPQDIFRLNLTARKTDMDVGMLGLDEGSTLAKTIYGDKISGQRIVDVLNEIKEINERMLKLNVDMDTRDALGMSRVPDLLFGISSPYGRLGELGGESIRQLEGLMQPQSLAHEAFLYTSLGTPNIKDFTEQMKGGIYEGDNLVNILKSIREATQGDETLSYFMLNEMMPGAPKGFIPRMTDLLSDEGKEITRFKIESIDEEGKIKYAEDEKGERIKETISGYTLEDFEKELTAYNEQINKLTLTAREDQEVREEINNALTGYSQRADEFTSESEKMIRTLHQNINEAAESWREMVYNAEIEMTRFWKRQAEDAEMFELFQIKLNAGLEDFENIIKRIKSDLGLGQDPIPKEISTAKPINPNPFIDSGHDPKDLRPINQLEWENFQENIKQGRGMVPSENFQNYMKEFDYERFEDIMDRTSRNSPKEITIIIKDETERGIESMIDNANSEFK